MVRLLLLIQTHLTPPLSHISTNILIKDFTPYERVVEKKKQKSDLNFPISSNKEGYNKYYRTDTVPHKQKTLQNDQCITSEFSPFQPFLPLNRPILDYKQKTPHK